MRQCCGADVSLRNVLLFFATMNLQSCSQPSIPPHDGGFVEARDSNGISDSVVIDPVSAEEYWLAKIGTGPQQTLRVCDRGYRDPVAKALCVDPLPEISGLRQLYERLGMPTRPGFTLSLASASSGLAAAITSVVNPRFIFNSFVGMLSRDEMGNVSPVMYLAFSRGERFVELFWYDINTDDLNFYLFSFRPTCKEERCSTKEMLSSDVETGWSGWTLYDQVDLEDTALDCLSCHRSGGPEGQKHLLMRDMPEPWFHWLPFIESEIGILSRCPDGEPHPESPSVFRSMFKKIHPEGYAGFNHDALDNANGHHLQSSIRIFEAQFRDDKMTSEPFVMPSGSVFIEWKCEGRKKDAWLAYREEPLLMRGLPIPYYDADMLDRTKAELAIADYSKFLDQNEDHDVFDVLSDLISDDAKISVGLVPDPAMTGDAIVRQMCVRCHDHRAPEGSRRARFDVERPGPSFREAIRRIQLPDDSPHVMPPRRAGTLAGESRNKALQYLENMSRENGDD